MSLSIEVVYALPDHQDVVQVECHNGASIREAIALSGVLERHSDLNLDQLEAGVYGLKQDLDYELSDCDRVEIYRPLLLSPTEARRLRAVSRDK